VCFLCVSDSEWEKGRRKQQQHDVVVCVKRRERKSDGPATTSYQLRKVYDSLEIDSQKIQDPVWNVVCVCCMYMCGVCML